MMNKTEADEMKGLLAQMPKSSLAQLKRLINAELDIRTDTKRTIRPVTPWGDFLTRGQHE
jgi:hypothetical protein